MYGRLTDKDLKKILGLSHDWEITKRKYDEIIALHKPSGKLWAFRY